MRSQMCECQTNDVRSYCIKQYYNTLIHKQNICTDSLLAKMTVIFLATEMLV